MATRSLAFSGMNWACYFGQAMPWLLKACVPSSVKWGGVGWVTMKAPSSSGRVPVSVSSFKWSVPQKKDNLLEKVE